MSDIRRLKRGIPMLRTFAVLALLVSPSAFACGGKAPCGSSCDMAAHADATAADDVAAAAGEKVTLNVSGMTCGSCASRVTAALKAVDGVNAAKVDHATGVASIAFDAAKTDADALIAAVAELGKFQAKKAEEQS
ncbi:MAG: heavy-metal-associated domain-containing protein [Proteobacteria bacterium]|nr:heavy-metal-associated domain-containing protein [Pseudomonadota bacterium]